MIMILIVVVFTSCNVLRIVVNVYEVSIVMIMIRIVVVFTSCNVIRIVVNVYEVNIVMILIFIANVSTYIHRIHCDPDLVNIFEMRMVPIRLLIVVVFSSCKVIWIVIKISEVNIARIMIVSTRILCVDTTIIVIRIEVNACEMSIVIIIT